MIKTREVSYTADKLTMLGHLAVPDGAGPWPAVLVGHDGIGLNDFQRGYADDLAERGYAALAMEYHGGRWFSDFEALLARVLPLIADPGRMEAIGRAALEVLLAEPGVDIDRLGAVGLGAGGSIVLELARAGVPFQQVAVVHPGVPQARSEEWATITGTVLLCTGSEDPLCGPDQLMAFARVLQDAGVDWQMNVYGGATHGFWHPPVELDGTLTEASEHEHSEPSHAGHHPAHARRVWSDIVELLAENLLQSTASVRSP